MRVLVTGGCGYIGCKLTPALVAAGHDVTVLDTMFFGNQLPSCVSGPGALRVIQADIRDVPAVRAALAGTQVVMHLAALSSNPSAEMDPEVTREINRDASLALLEASREAGVQRFIFASSSTNYGVRDEPVVDETLDHRPITPYGKYKSEIDLAVLAANGPGFTTTCLRAATVGGFSPRMRLDLTVNVLTSKAVLDGRITVHGGQQMRPTLGIDDAVGAYLALLSAPARTIGGRAYNVGVENHSVLEIAQIIREVVVPEARIVIEPVLDPRSYRISSERIVTELGFRPTQTVAETALEVAEAIRSGRLQQPRSSVWRNRDHLESNQLLRPFAASGPGPSAAGSSSGQQR